MSRTASTRSWKPVHAATALLMPLALASALAGGAGAVEPLEPTAAGTDPGPEPGIVLGKDSRVASHDPRVARLIGGGACTAWLTSAGVALTARHCTPNPATGKFTLQFNVPRSTATGAHNNPPPKFTFYAASVADSGSNIPGNDWRVLKVSPNVDGESAFDVMGRVFRPRAIAPVVGDNVTVTSYGIDFTPPNRARKATCKHDLIGRPTEDCNAQSLTEQTDAGAVTGTGGTWVTYAVDTERASSGAPVFLPGTDTALAIHHGGADAPCLRANCGTLLSAPGLEDAIADVHKGRSDRVVFVDSGGNKRDAADTGQPYTPYRRLSEAMSHVCPGQRCPRTNVTIALAPGNYAGWSFTSPPGAQLTFIAPAGRATIGAATPPYGNPTP